MKTQKLNFLGVAKREFPNRETHFFHFPVKDRQRCIKWCIYSNNMSFLSLPDEKLKNKVICDFHFPESHFMNYKREKLNKTNAVPIHYINKTKDVIDLETSPTSWVESNHSQSLDDQDDKIPLSKIDIDDKEVTIEVQNYDSPPAKKPKIQIQSVQKMHPVKILNSNYELTPKTLPTQSSSSSAVKSVMKSGSQNFTIRKFSSPQKVRAKVEESQDSIVQIHTLDMSDEKDLYQNMVLIEPETTEIKEDPLNEIKPLLEQSLRDSADIKQLLKQKLNSQIETTPSKSNETPSSISKSHLNKTQLFNGIKRYLSPSLTALLSMELFGAPSREYTSDEKIICTEILQLGDETYNFFAEEWRIRLPAIDKVKDWLKTGDLDDEN